MRAIFLAVIFSGCGLNPISAEPPSESGSAITDYMMIGDVQVSPSVLDFGAVQPDSSATLEVTLTNLGSSDAELSSAYLEGDTAFSVTTSAPEGITPGAEAVVTVSFTPTVEQDYIGTLNILLAGEPDIAVMDISGIGSFDASSDTGDTDTTPSGTGELTLSNDVVDFGKVPIGTTAARSVEVTNTGGEDILISDVTSTIAVVSGDLGVPLLLSPGESEDLLIQYAPTQETEIVATLTIESDAPGASPTVTVTGIGYEACEICEPRLMVTTGGSDSYTMDQFNATTLNNPDEQTMTLNNTGDMDLVVTAIDIVNDNDTPSKVFCGRDGNYNLGSVSLPLTIPAFGAASVPVRYRYSGSSLLCGEYSFDSAVNVLTITSNSATGSTYSISLGGGYTIF
jgi:hypothetical protein